MTSVKPHMTSRDARETKEREAEGEEKKSRDYLKAINDSKILWLLLIALFELYLIFKHSLLAPLIVLALGAIVVIELMVGLRSGGLAHELKETAVAILVAVVLWYGMSWFLNTSVPLDAVVSCSMLPNLQRGDMLVLHGGEVEVQVVRMSAKEWEYTRASGLLNRVCAQCSDGNLTWGCLTDPRGRPVPPTGVFDYQCGMCQRQKSTGETDWIPCTTGVKVRGSLIPTNTTGDIVVYAPIVGDPFFRSGDIVHRVRFVADVDGRKYVFTKGDNNNWYDVQMGNEPVDPARIKGIMLGRIPFVGYLKLFISGMFGEPAGCNVRFTAAQLIKSDG